MKQRRSDVKKHRQEQQARQPGVRIAQMNHFDVDAWSKQTIAPDVPTLRRVRGRPGGLAIAVGDGGSIVHRLR